MVEVNKAQRLGSGRPKFGVMEAQSLGSIKPKFGVQRLRSIRSKFGVKISYLHAGLFVIPRRLCRHHLGVGVVGGGVALPLLPHHGGDGAEGVGHRSGVKGGRNGVRAKRLGVSEAEIRGRREEEGLQTMK